MTDDQEWVIEEAFLYFRHVDVMASLRQKLRSINANVNIHYREEYPCIEIDCAYRIYVPFEDGLKYYSFFTVSSCSGSYYDPPDEHEKLIYEEECYNYEDFISKVVAYYSKHYYRNYGEHDEA